jgi:CubicO group peptidase (beta-lactamase class C family)
MRLSDRQIARELKAFTERMARADVFSGVVALAHNGVPVFEAAYGESNKALHIENRRGTKFNLASMGKMFTAVAIAGGRYVGSGDRRGHRLLGASATY